MCQTTRQRCGSPQTITALRAPENAAASAQLLDFQFWDWVELLLCADGSLRSLRCALTGWSPFLYSVRGSLSTKSPSSLCLSLRASLCLCWISCPTTKTEPLGKPNSQSLPPSCFTDTDTHTHTHTHTHTQYAYTQVSQMNYFADAGHLVLALCVPYLWNPSSSDIQTINKFDYSVVFSLCNDCKHVFLDWEILWLFWTFIY